jgi:hypothetical protein
MTWLELIQETGKADLIELFLHDKITRLELAQELSSSGTDLVVQYKNDYKNALHEHLLIEQGKGTMINTLDIQMEEDLER